MLAILMIIGSVVIMSKVAHMEDRSPLLWGGLTLAICLLCAHVLPWPLLNIFIGLVVSFGIMFTLNIMSEKKG